MLTGSVSPMVKGITYHYVGDTPLLRGFHRISRSDFLTKLNSSSRHSIMSLDELNLFLEGGQVDENKVILTFDDGLKCHFEVVAPILQELNLGAIFFVPGPIETLLNVHQAHWILAQNIPDSAVFDFCSRYMEQRGKLAMTRETYSNQVLGAGAKALKTLVNYTFTEGCAGRFLSDMKAFFGLDFPMKTDFYMTDSEILNLDKMGFVIGGHTSHHLCLSMLDKDRQEEEITANLKYLRSLLDGEVSTFAFPFGRVQTFNADSLEILEKLNIRLAFQVGGLRNDHYQESGGVHLVGREDCNAW